MFEFCKFGAVACASLLLVSCATSQAGSSDASDAIRVAPAFDGFKDYESLPDPKLVASKITGVDAERAAECKIQSGLSVEDLKRDSLSLVGPKKADRMRMSQRFSYSSAIWTLAFDRLKGDDYNSAGAAAKRGLAGFGRAMLGFGVKNQRKAGYERAESCVALFEPYLAEFSKG